MSDTIELLEGFEELKFFLIGNPKQFITYQGELFCLRKSCDGCPHVGTCEFEEGELQAGYLEHPRRGIAFENKPFLVLILKEGLRFEKDVPKDLWDSEYSNLSLNESNNHYILANQKSKFRVLKGHFRYYDTVEEFEKSEYNKYFKVFDRYEPTHYLMAMDLSAIEPRVSTIVSREPEWIKIFQGTPKVVAKEIEIKKGEE
jgi:hypothetical protein